MSCILITLIVVTVVQCGSPPSVDNAVMTPAATTTYGANVTYTCLPGFWFSPADYSQTITCTAEEKWSSLTTNKCTRTCVTRYFICEAQFSKLGHFIFH